MAEEPGAHDPLTAVEGKVDQLAQSVDERFAAVDKRFDAVDDALVEQREYTEFAFDKITAAITEVRTEVGTGFTAVSGRFDRLERKLDQFIDIQSVSRPRPNDPARVAPRRRKR